MQTPRTRPDASAEEPDWPALAADIRRWGKALGFQEIGVAGTDLDDEERRLIDWLAAGRHGAMDYMARHGVARARPGELVAGTLRVITARMNYRPPAARASEDVLHDPAKAFIARYALGRDYHKVLRGKLQRLADRIAATIGEFGYRVFTDSAPVMEVALAAKSGIGWQGKHTLLLTRDAGSWFFLGEIYTDLPLPVTPPQPSHCGSCSACIDICPTGAIVAPYELDARRCISYLTIELPGSIPEDTAAADRQPCLRLRRLPALLPLEPVRAGCGRAGFRRAQRARRRGSRRAVRVDRGRVQFAPGGQRDPADRLRAMVAQSGGRPRQRAGRSRRSSPRSRPAPTIRRRWCASTSHGRWRGTDGDAGRPRGPGA